MGDPDLWVVSREGPADLTGRVGAAGLSRLMTALLILSLRISKKSHIANYYNLLLSFHIRLTLSQQFIEYSENTVTSSASVAKV